jgi:hypothetical protein
MFRKIQIWTDEKLSDSDKLLLKEEGIDSKKWLINDRFFNIDHWNDLQLEKLFLFLENHGYKKRIVSDFIAYEKFDIEDWDYAYVDGQTVPTTQIVLNPDFLDGNPSLDYSQICPICRTGALQIKPLTFDWKPNKPLGKRFLTPATFQAWLVGTELKNILESANLSGLQFLPVYRKMGNIISDTWQLKPDNVLPKSLVKECYKRSDRSRNCNCENGMMSFIDLHNIFLENKIHTLLKDFSETNERFHPNCGAYIMSRRMALVLIDAGIEPMKNVYYWPVKLLPSQ